MNKNLYVLRSAHTQSFYNGSNFSEPYASRAALITARNEFEAIRDGCHPWTGRIEAICMAPADPETHEQTVKP